MVLMKERLKAYYITSGYFEDEIEMIRNCHANLRRWDFRVIESVPVREQSFPVLIVGAGPSLDRDMPHLKALRERAIVVSCGTSIGILLKNGIRPDLHCEIERGELVHELLAKVARRVRLRRHHPDRLDDRRSARLLAVRRSRGSSCAAVSARPAC